MNARLKLSDSLNLIKSFKTSGTITPSSKVLIKTLLAPIDFTSARCLIELGPVTTPAYPDTSVAKRDLESLKEEKKPKMVSVLDKELKYKHLRSKM